MSEAKAPKKGDAGPKKPEAKTTEAKTTEAKKPEGGTSAPAEASAGKADAAPKSASQSSISHFSSVSTPAYRSGWNAIFGNGKAAGKAKSKTSDGEDFPNRLEIADEDIDAELRAVLYKRFQREARRQGFSLARTKKLADIAYHLECSIKAK